MQLQKQIDQLITRQASDWIERLRGGDVAERAAFVAWLKESRRHVEEFLTMVAVDRELGGIDAGRQHDLEALLHQVAPHVMQLSGRPRAGQTKTLRAWWKPALAAGVALAPLALWILRGSLLPAQEFVTGTGEQRAIELPDGSLLHLNTRSRVVLRMNEHERNLELTEGEALFKVARDPHRPFRVHTRDTVVQALGTEFNVYARPNGTVVSVLQGKVSVSSNRESASAALNVGEEARVDREGHIQRQPVKDTAAAWRERRLIFHDHTLEDIAAEFNRYNSRPRFRLESAAVRQRHYSGTFDADDPESLAALIARESDVSVETSGEQIVIRPR